ncbi:MAG: MBL fold metallo-hydrolase [Candidatus Krumholzibacteriia bacterium]
MRILMAGTRGSAPVTAPAALPFGGDTTCLLVTGAGGERIVLDCGTGLPALAPRLGRAPELLVLLTHFHLDHLAGLGTFSPLYAAGARITFAGPRHGGVGVEQAVRGLLQPPYWPIAIDAMASTIAFRELAPEGTETPLRHCGLEVRWTAVPHPGGCTAYRVDEPATGGAMVLATDLEWDGADPAQRQALVALCREPRPAQLLVHDGQYDADDYERVRGWGHAVAEDAVALAREAGVARLLITHHDPTHDAATLLAREQRLQTMQAGARPAVALARQGEEIMLEEDFR